MFNRENYSKRTLSTFEIVSSFIVSLYYNNLYQEAKKIRIAGRVESVTDGYKHAVKAYLASFNSPSAYKKTICGIHKYYYTTTRFGTISFSECVNEIVRHFVPVDFFDSTSNNQRDGILKMVLTNAVKQFSSNVLCTHVLDEIIENHGDKSTIRQMQDLMVNALVLEREKIFQKIFKAANTPKGGEDLSVVMKLKAEMVKLVKKNHILTQKYKSLKEKTLEVLNVSKTQTAQIAQLKEHIASNPPRPANTSQPANSVVQHRVSPMPHPTSTMRRETNPVSYLTQREVSPVAQYGGMQHEKEDEELALMNEQDRLSDGHLSEEDLNMGYEITDYEIVDVDTTLEKNTTSTDRMDDTPSLIGGNAIPTRGNATSINDTLIEGNAIPTRGSEIQQEHIPEENTQEEDMPQSTISTSSVQQDGYFLNELSID